MIDYRYEPSHKRVIHILLDLMLPDISDSEICKRLRQTSGKVPVVFLTAKDDIGDSVAGLNIEAHDYIVLPFSLNELLAGVIALGFAVTCDAPKRSTPLSHSSANSL